MVKFRVAGLLSSLAFTLSVTSWAYAAEGDVEWELRRDKNGVQIFTGAVAGSSFKAVKATATMSTTVNELVALVMDVDACGEWAELCEKAVVIEAASETELLVYTLNNLPWPVSDRDAVTRVVWSQVAASAADTNASVTMTATVVESSDAQWAQDRGKEWAPKRGKVRLSYGVTQWTFTPRTVTDSGGETRQEVDVSSYAHVDPGGAVPAWLTNRLLVDAPFDTVVAMRELVQTGHYAGAKFAFID